MLLHFNISFSLESNVQNGTAGVACSKHSDSGERCKVKKAMKRRGGLRREMRERLEEFLTKVRSGISDPGIPSD